MLQADEGYYFGIGAFETIAVENGIPIFLEAHKKRLEKAIDFLKLPTKMEEVDAEIGKALKNEALKHDRKVLKVTVSEKNILVSFRENPYTNKDYEKGFSTELSPVRRNETSAFTYHKTLNYGDCLFEKREAKKRGIDEPIFLNTKGELAEGAVSNIFFVKDGVIHTPTVSSGLLPGIMRGYLLENYPVIERIILPQEIESFDEMFVTNSLLGVMPVNRLGTHEFASREKTEQVLEEYRKGIGVVK